MKPKGGFKVGDGVLVLSDRGEILPGVFAGVDGLLGCVELGHAEAVAMGHKRAGEYWVSVRRIRATDGAQTATPRATEHEIQKAIVDALRLAGLTVYETTAYRQKGPSGVDKGIPDLLVCDPDSSRTYCGIEVKPPGPVRWSSPEQRAAYDAGCFYVVQSPEEALERMQEWLCTRDWHGRINRVLAALRESTP